MFRWIYNLTSTPDDGHLLNPQMGGPATTAVREQNIVSTMNRGFDGHEHNYLEDEKVEEEEKVEGNNKISTFRTKGA